MYERIKQLADEAVALQNKARMEEVLREISGMCDHARRPLDLGAFEYGFPPAKMTAEQFEADALGTHRAARANPAVMESAAKLKDAIAPAAKKAKKEAK